MIALHLTRWAMRRPRLLLAVLAVATALAATGATRLRSVSYWEGHLPSDDPELERVRRVEAEFGSARMAIFAVGCGETRPCADVFEADVLALLHDLTARARARPEVLEAQSLATAGVLVEDTGALRVERLEPGAAAPAIASYRERVRGDPILAGTLVSEDLRTAALLVRFEPSLVDAKRNAVVTDLLGELSAAARSAGFVLHATGGAVLGAVTDAYFRHDLELLTPIMLAIVVALLAWIVREPRSIGLALATVALPCVWAFGLMGWTGRPVTPVVSTLPILILVVGITDALHFLIRAGDLQRGARHGAEAALAVAREVGPPTTVTALTASVGFLSFLAGPIPALREFGVFAALGILGAWFLTFTLLPLGLERRRPRAPARRPLAARVGERLLRAAHGLAHRRSGAVLAVAALACGVAAVGVSRLTVLNDGMNLIGTDDPLTHAERFVRLRLRPRASVELVYAPPPGELLLAPSTLTRLEAAEHILSEGDVGPVVSILSVLRVANREVGSGDFALPDDPRAAGQLLLLAESADARALSRIVTPDRGLTRLSVGWRVEGTASARSVLDGLRSSLGSLLDGHGEWFLTGGLVLSIHQGDLVLDSQLASFSTAFLVIFGVLFLFTRSIALSALGMVPNAVPVAWILGWMGLAGIYLDVGTAMIASIVLGVSVDDTVYFLSHYREARARGAGVREATAWTFERAGRPALFTAALLAAGFFVLGFSKFQSLGRFGVLAGAALLLAAAAELLLMPALLELTARRRRAATPATAPNPASRPPA